MREFPGILSFLARFPDEPTCWEHLREARWPDGFTCPMCSEDEDSIFLDKRKRWHCYACGRQASITAGTNLQDTKRDLQPWFLAAYLIFTTKRVNLVGNRAVNAGASPVPRGPARPPHDTGGTCSQALGGHRRRKRRRRWARA